MCSLTAGKVHRTLLWPEDNGQEQWGWLWQLSPEHPGSSERSHTGCPAHSTPLELPPQAWLALGWQVPLAGLTAAGLCSPPQAGVTFKKHVKMKGVLSCTHMTWGTAVQEIKQHSSTVTAALH